MQRIELGAIRGERAVRSLAPAIARRSALGLATGGILGAVALGDVASTKKRHKRKNKKRCPSCPALRNCGDGCCPTGQVCGSNGACLNPTCCSGEATCGPYSSARRLCCVAPQTAVCCCDSSPGAGNGFVQCCEFGVDCDACPSGTVAVGGLTNGPANVTTGACAEGGDGTADCPG